MIFEYWFEPGDDAAYQEYLAQSAELRDLLPGVDGFLGIQRFASETESRHFFAGYRLRMAEVLRDYGPADRDQAPVDSRAAHGSPE